MKNALVVICSRAESRRLPGKVFKKIAGVPALHHILNRLSATGIKVVVAVPDAERMIFGEALRDYPDVDLFTGRGDSPLHRMAAVARKYNPDWVVRVTHDDILIDAQTVLQLLDCCEEVGADYGITPSIADGAGVEVISAANLLRAADKRSEPTEFISYFVRGEFAGNPKVARFKPREAVARPYRLTMDYPEDALLLEAVLRAVGPNATLDAVCAHLDRNPHLLNVNRIPDLSIYTCALNAAKWAGFAAASVLGLGLPRLEYVFVDDASTDDTLDRVLTFAHDKRMKIVVNETNLGLASSSNIALNHCRGRAVMRLDADDLLTGAFESDISIMLARLRQGAQVVYPAYYEINEDGAITGAPCDPRLYHHAGGAIFDKKFLDELRFRDGIRHWDGLDLYERMSALNLKLAYWDVPTWMYRQHTNSMSKTDLEARGRLKTEILGGSQ